MSVSKEQVVEFIKSMSVIELSEFVKELEEIFGVSAAAPVAAVAAAPAAAAVAEEKTEFDVILSDVGPEKMKIVKAIRDATGLGLKESKAIADEAPKPIKQAVSKDEANKIKALIEEAGGKVEIK